jgi:hypothetical protein
MQGLMPQGVSRFDVTLAYYVIASRYHSGQWSKGYAKLSQCSRIGLNIGMSYPEREPDIRALAAQLLWKRRREIRKHW